MISNLINQINCRFERDATGLIGLKSFEVSDKGLKSPVQKTHWTGPLLVADNWTNSGAVRGLAGIHACWPWTPEEVLLLFNRESNSCLVEVRGFGDTVQGKLGWRAERVMLHVVHCFPWQLVDICVSPEGELGGFYSEVPVVPDLAKWVKVLLSLLKPDEPHPHFKADTMRWLNWISKHHL